MVTTTQDLYIGGSFVRRAFDELRTFFCRLHGSDGIG